jgi:hypothetical protein
MPGPTDFYRFFYCAVGDRQRRPSTGRHATGSRPVATAGLERLLSSARARRSEHEGRSSGFGGVGSILQRLIPTGRPGIDGLRVWQTSPIGSNRRGR